MRNLPCFSSEQIPAYAGFFCPAACVGNGRVTLPSVMCMAVISGFCLLRLKKKTAASAFEVHRESWYIFPGLPLYVDIGTLIAVFPVL
jgi:hypothetical protein